jgi:hypothetical protein
MSMKMMSCFGASLLPRRGRENDSHVGATADRSDALPNALMPECYFFTQKSPGRMKPSPRMGLLSQPPVLGTWQPI